MAETVPPAAPQWRSYVTLFCGLSGALVLAVAALNYVVDPYLTHQWQSPLLQRPRPLRERLSAWGKTYAIAKLRPQVLYVGNSRTEVALPTQMPMFAGNSVFNGALSGASVGDAIAVVGHAARMSRLQTVVWGIDAPSFSLAEGADELSPELVAGGAFFFTRRALLNLRRGLALDMTRDSLRILSGSDGGVCRSSLVFGGQRDNDCLAGRARGRSATRAAVVPRVREFLAGDGPTVAALGAFEASVTALCRQHTRLRLYINPTHAMTLDVLYWGGKWAAVEGWQHSLSELAARQRRAGCDLRLFDFSGYNSITTDPIPQASARDDMQHYWETSHYRSSVGRMVLGRLFGDGSGVPADFGVELEPATLAIHVANLRAARERYHSAHPQETALARAVAAGAAEAPPR